MERTRRAVSIWPATPRRRRAALPTAMLIAAAVFALLALAGCTGRDIIGVADGWTPVAVEDGTVYSATRDGDVLALNAQELDRDENASAIWEFSPSEDWELGSVFGPPAVGDEFIYVGSSDSDGERGKLTALRKDRQSGTRVEQAEWQERLGGAMIGGPTVAGDRVLAGSEDGMMYAFDAATGGKLWAYATMGQRAGSDKEQRIWSTPAVNGETAYFGAMDGYVYAVALETGAERWKFLTGGAVVSQPVVVNGMVVFGSFDRSLYALDAATGAVVWTYDSEHWFWSAPVTDGTNVYAADMGGQVVALPLDRGSGDSPLWTHEMRATVNATPALAGNKLVVAADSGIVSVLDTATGTADEIPLALEKDIRAPLASAGSGETARVYFGDSDGVIRSLDVERWRVSWSLETRE